MKFQVNLASLFNKMSIQAKAFLFLNNNWKRTLRFIGLYALIFFLIRLDWASKTTAFEVVPAMQLKYQLTYPIIRVNPYFSFINVNNEGVSFGIFSNMPHRREVLSFVAIIVSVAFFANIHITNAKLARFGSALLTSGAIGNAIDRLYYGSVRDFLDFHYGDYHWPAFNFADVYVFIGIVMFISADIFFTTKTNNPVGLTKK